MLRTDRSYPLEDPPAVVWRALESVEDYRRWWPWLRSFDARRLAAGERWTARIRVPMPWDLRFRLDLGSVTPPERVEAVLDGDIEGTASITVARVGGGSTIRLQSALAPRHRWLRAVNRYLPAVSRRVHDRVVDTAFRQFAERPRSEPAEADR